MRRLISLSFILFLISCQKQPETTTQNFTEIVISTTKAQSNAKYSSFVDEYEFVQLETGKNFLIGKIDKIKTTSQFIYILDRFSAKALFQFDRKGKFVQKIGGIGSGPGEYELPLDFTIDEQKQEIIVNNLGASLLFYDLSGKYLRKKNLVDFSIIDLEVLPKEGFAFIGGGRDDNLIITDSQQNREKSFFPFTIRDFNIAIIYPFQKINDSTVLYRKDFIDTIYNITSKKPIPHCVLNYQEKSAPMEKILKEVKLTQKKPNTFDKYCRTASYFEQADFIIVFFIYQGTPYITIFNKKNKNVYTIKNNSAINDLGLDKNSSIVGTDNSTKTFIWKIEPQSFIKAFEEMQTQYTNQAFYQKIINLKKNIKENDNPVLMFTKLK